MLWLRRLALGLTGLVGLLVLAVLLWAAIPPWTPSLAKEGSIATLETVVLGGFEQTLLIRGESKDLPVLLYLHGGPGGGQIPIARFYSEELEKHFVVVHWDQAGAGASCDGVDWDSLSLERIVSDTLELSEQLGKRFGRSKKIVLLGHSWGSMVGALAVQRRPDLFHAYIGLGQLVHGHRNEELSLNWVLAEAKRRGDQEALEALAGMSLPYQEGELELQRTWLNEYDGSIYATDRARPALLPGLFAPEYSLRHRINYVDCFRASLDALWGEVDGIDFMTQIPALDVPVYFFTGRHDWNTPYPLVEEWAETLKAPHLEIVWFEDAGHMIPIESPAAFQQQIIEKVLPTTD